MTITSEENRKLMPGNIIVMNSGYSMVIYDFYRVVRNNNVSIWLQPMNKTTVCDLDAPYYGHPVVKPTDDDKARAPIRKSIKTYVGRLWDGKPLVEDHMD